MGYINYAAFLIHHMLHEGDRGAIEYLLFILKQEGYDSRLLIDELERLDQLHPEGCCAEAVS